MGQVLVVAEKPSVARDIARVVGAKNRKEGYLEGNGYIVTWALGHLVTLAEPEDIDEKYKRWTLKELPMLPDEIPLKVISKTKKQFNVIKKLMKDKSVTSILCATDSGREGELIFRRIYETAGCAKPVRRLWISSMTDSAVKKGLEEAKDAGDYDNLYLSARSRAEADYLVGMNATRAYTVRYNALLTVGRVQTPTLAFLTARQREIDSFVPEDYYVITADFGDYKGQWLDPETGKPRADSEETADAVVARVRGKEGLVTKMLREKKRQLSPLLYDLTELQRDCNRSFGFSAKKTLSVAQALYERHKVITYPRTDSRYLTADMRPKVYGVIKNMNVPALKEAAEQLQALEKLPFSPRIINDARVSDHHAIIPTGNKVNFESLTPDEQKVYDKVARRLISVLMPPWLYDDVTIHTKVDIDTFQTRGRLTESLGWKALYAGEEAAKKKSEDDPEAVLPELSEGDRRKVVRCTKAKKKTKPPAAYTEATLLSAMEHAGRSVDDEELAQQMKNAGLGTPATRAAIIERLIQSEYVRRRGRSLVPTQKGMDLIGIVPDEMRSAKMTGQWEKSLNDMARGQADEKRFRESIEKFVKYIVERAKTDEKTVKFERPMGKGAKKTVSAESFGPCPKCTQGEVRENSKAFYCTRWKDGCQLNWWKEGLKKKGGPALSAAIVKRLLADGKAAGSTGVITAGKDHTLTFTPKEKK
ncbi:MAG: DNA topoisomerase 3 [Christensenellales bacterium]|jgi:DNA topoisomerase-3